MAASRGSGRNFETLERAIRDYRARPCVGGHCQSPSFDEAGNSPELPRPVIAPTEPAVPWVFRAWRRLLREPSLLVTVAYLFVSFLGLWANYWFYRGFGIPILEYMQASDYLVAGLRDPAYALLLAWSVLLTLLISGPDVYRRHHPERVAVLRRKVWGRLVFPESRWLRWKGLGLAPETGVAFAVFVGLVFMSSSYVMGKGEAIRAGKAGHRVQVTLAGAPAPLPNPARLLGSSSAFVFLWWPHARLAEAVPIESVGRLQSARLRGSDTSSKPAVPSAAKSAVPRQVRKAGPCPESN